jgi:FKBP-type peptidyl-prolyl cis-trans isomerase FkpA
LQSYKSNQIMKSTLIALVSLLFVSCLSDPATQQVDYTVQNEKEIKDYLTAKKLIAVKSDTGLYYIINEPGTGKQPTANSNVTVAYKGYFTDGKVFDQSNEAGISFGLQQVIKGWTEGIPYFKEGGSGVLLIPSSLGYGNSTRGPIPGGSVLVFDIKLIKVN